MELSCPACGARYRIDAAAAAAAPGSGQRQRRARCSACGHVFGVPPAAGNGGQPPPEVAGEEEGEEAAPARKILLPLLAVIAVVIAVAAGTALLRPDLVAATGLRLPEIAFPEMRIAAIGLPKIELPAAPASPLLVETRTTRRPLADGRLAFEVTGRIRNPTARTEIVPPVELLLIDAGGAVVDRWTTRTRERRLAPGHTAAFATSNVDPPAAARHLRAQLKPAAPGRL